MMTLVRIVSFLHLAVYLGIMWYGWQSYRTQRKSSWKVMGIGFGVLLLYRIRELILQMSVDYPIDTIGTLIPFIGSLFLLLAFWMLYGDSRYVMELMRHLPTPLMSGAQPVDYWLVKIREIIREEIASASGTTTVTVKGPSATEPVVEKSSP